MLYYLRLIGLFLRVSIQEEMAFRMNFVVNILGTILSLTTGILGIAILFHVVTTIQGWTFPETFTLLAIYQLITALQNLVIEPSMVSLGGIDGDAWTGRFDYTLQAPVSTQFLVSFRKWRLWSFIDVSLSLVLLCIALTLLGKHIGLLQLAMFVFNLCISLLIVYAIFLLLSSASLWQQGIPLTWIFNSVMQLGRYPVGLYPGALRLLLTWVVPVAFITTIPVEVLTRQASPLVLMAGAAIALGLFVLASFFFRMSLRHYTSASS
jgi:ABC-2 type transport system permease protein